jgi:hypothetical protein
MSLFYNFLEKFGNDIVKILDIIVCIRTVVPLYVEGNSSGKGVSV